MHPTSVNNSLPKAGCKLCLWLRCGPLSSQFDKPGEGRRPAKPPSILQAMRAVCLSQSGPALREGQSCCAEVLATVGRQAASWGVTLLTSCMNFLQTGRISLLRVALNIIHCFSWGVRRKISCTSRRMSSCSSILSHSSSTKCFTFLRLRLLLRTRARIRPGVPTTTWGQFFFNTSSSFLMERPPKNTDTYGDRRKAVSTILREPDTPALLPQNPGRLKSRSKAEGLGGGWA